MSEHKTGKYFKYTIGEIVLVVIGILIALSINNWNEQRLQVFAQKTIYKQVRLNSTIEQRFMLESRYASQYLSRSNEITLPPQSKEVLAFPTALGAAAHATGGTLGDVYHVTNLNDTGSGSFRDAVSVGNRTIVFDVSGTINLATILYITVDNLTIAGQTAPEGGIAITGKNVYIRDNDNIILRYVYFRPVFNSSASIDALNAYNVTNLIVDHCSISWGGDEAFSITGASSNITVQNTILGESKTAMLAGDSNNPISFNYSIINNLFYNISHRFPNVNALRTDVINNVVHNWQSRICVISAHDNVRLNQIANYYQSGVTTNSPIAPDYSVNWTDSSGRPNIRIYTEDNVYPNVVDLGDDNWNLYSERFVPWNRSDLNLRSLTPFTLLGKTFIPKTAAQALVDTQNLGANKYLNGDGTYGTENDNVDTIYLKNVGNNTSEAYLFPQTDIVNKQSYFDYQAAISNTPINTRPAGFYGSSLHIPEAWFLANVPSGKDYNDIAPNGYTYLNSYLNTVD